MKLMTQGVLLCLLSQCLFGVLYLFSLWLQPLNGTDVFAWRMVAMLFCLALIIFPTVGYRAILRLMKENLGYHFSRWAIFLLGTINAGSQFWLFMWAPVNNEGVNIAMGYFLFPLVMEILGRIWLKEPLSHIQKLALCLAACGVAHELWHTQSFSWTSLWVCLVYPFYYLSRKKMQIPALQGIALDIFLISIPCAIYLIYQGNSFQLIADEWRYWYLLPALGMVSAIGLSANLKSSQQIPVSLFAVLSYIEPALLFLIALVWLDTAVSPADYLTYIPIWASLILLGGNGLIKNRDKNNRTLAGKSNE
ncbi:transporter [Rodentibacter rarus]|uniref:EamA family transporter RarD n=1 Tax=Rodentibacter rarus TaxID=1908260 RepID=UPI0009840E61|nr:EamA family transporter RarD [Rodentibacter rarus]OOF43242.1 transporter [Rodentibacter rarus]